VASKREEPATTGTNKKTVAQQSDGRDGGAMELAEFVTEYRRKVQRHLWNREDKITVADLVRLADLERETQKLSQSNRPKELRVLWIDKKSTT
jgi:hypothetical protein